MGGGTSDNGAQLVWTGDVDAPSPCARLVRRNWAATARGYSWLLCGCGSAKKWRRTTTLLLARALKKCAGKDSVTQGRFAGRHAQLAGNGLRYNSLHGNNAEFIPGSASCQSRTWPSLGQPRYKDLWPPAARDVRYKRHATACLLTVIPLSTSLLAAVPQLHCGATLCGGTYTWKLTKKNKPHRHRGRKGMKNEELRVQNDGHYLPQSFFILNSPLSTLHSPSILGGAMFRWAVRVPKIECGIDQRHVRKGLRKIANEPTGVGFVFFREQADAVG